MKKLLFYSHDSYGLGNIRRMVAIAEYLVNHNRDVYILLLTGSPMLHAFRTHSQIDYIKLPCLQRSQDAAYSAKLECFNIDSLIQMRSALIRSSIEGFEPDLILVDKKPEGLSGELRETIDSLESQTNKPRQVLLLRDILDDPHVTHSIWSKNRYFKLIDEWYDEVLVVGEKAIFDVSEQYQFPASNRKKVTYCGYLNRTRKYGHSQGSELSEQDQKLIIVAVGGGDDGRKVLESYINGLAEAAWYGDVKSILFYGPEMDQRDYSHLTELVRGRANIELKEFTNEFERYLEHSDLVISMGGYNTVCEVLSYHKPMIIIPRVAPVSEQLIRAQCFYEKGIVDYIHPDVLTSEVLMSKVSHMLDKDTSDEFARELNMHGMEILEQRLLHI